MKHIIFNYIYKEIDNICIIYMSIYKLYVSLCQGHMYLSVYGEISKITRMTKFIKTKFNKSDDQTNIDNIELLLILNSIR